MVSFTMRFIFLSLSILFTLTAKSQITIKKLMLFLEQPEESANMALIHASWEFIRTDTTDRIHDVWAYKFDKSKNYAERWIYIFDVEGYVQRLLYMNMTKDEFDQFLVELPQIGFTKTKEFNQDGTEYVYEKISSDKFYLGDIVRFRKPNDQRDYFEFSVEVYPKKK